MPYEHTLNDHAARVSVVVPNYNHAPFLEQRIASILDQRHRPFELILLDDASTDGSMEIIDRYAGMPNTTVVRNDVNSGNPFAQWNRGVAIAQGEYVWIAESDDYAAPDFLQRLIAMLEAHPECGMACSESWYVYGDQPPRTRTNQSHIPENSRWRDDYVVDGREECRRHLIRCNTMPNASAVVFRRHLFHAVEGADEGMRLCGDWLLWAKLLMISDLAHVGDPLNFYRCGTAMVRKKNHATARTLREVYRVLEYLVAHAGVSPDILSEVLAARGERFVESALLHGFNARDALGIYQTARRVDPNAFSRIMLRWCRLQAGAALRRYRRAPLTDT